jgi:type II secretory pathway component PulC
LLSGISKTENGFGVILEKKGERRIVFKGNTVWGYLVRNINMERVVMEKGGNTFTLSIN